MNSSLQCLAHAVPLVRTFLSDAYKADINRDNPLGNQGKLAEAFGEVMKKLWQVNAIGMDHSIQDPHSNELFMENNKLSTQSRLFNLQELVKVQLLKNKNMILYEEHSSPSQGLHGLDQVLQFLLDIA